MNEAGIIATIVLASLAVLGAIAGIFSTVTNIYTRLSNLETGSEYKDRRLDSLETAVKSVADDVKQVLQRMERRQHPRGAG